MGLGLKATGEGYPTCFTQAMPLIALLTKSYAEDRLEERQRITCQPKLLIVDEIGCVYPSTSTEPCPFS